MTSRIWCHLTSNPEKAMAPYSSILAWKIPWTEEPGRLQSMGSLGVRHDWVTSLSLFISCIGEGNGNPLQCSCLENLRDGGPGGLPSLGSHRVGHDWSNLAAAATSNRASQVALVIKNLPASQCRRLERCGYNPWVRKIPWKRKWQPALVFLPGKSHRQRSLVGYSPWGCKESDTTEHTHTNWLQPLNQSQSINFHLPKMKLIFTFTWSSNKTGMWESYTNHPKDLKTYVCT